MANINFKPKIFHGPINVAGMGYYCAQYQRKKGYVSDFIVYFNNKNRPVSHYDLKLYLYNKIERIFIIFFNFMNCLVKYDIFNFYFGKTLLPYGMDLPLLRLFGKKIIMIFCGSEVRLEKIENKRNPFNKYMGKEGIGAGTDRSKIIRLRWQNIWVHKFIAVRELTSTVEKYCSKNKVISDIWINNILGSNVLERYDRFEPNNPPVIIHAPSNKRKKGTEYIEKALNELKNEGYSFEYRRIENMLNIDAQRYYRDCDIIIDQLICGGFGTLAVEGMYYGKTVFCYVLPELFSQIPELPIVNTNINDLKDKLKWFLEHPEERKKIGQRGMKFYDKHLKPDVLQEKMLELYKNLIIKKG